MGLRLRVDKGLGRICGACSALGLEPAFRRGLGLGVGLNVQRKVNQNRSTRYVLGFTACEGLACEPWPPPQHHPTIQWQLQRAPPVSAHASPPPPPAPTRPCHGGRGGAGNARRLTIYSLCACLCIIMFPGGNTSMLRASSFVYTCTSIHTRLESGYTSMRAPTTICSYKYQHACRHMNIQTCRHADVQMDRQIDRQAGRQAGGQTYMHKS